MSFTYGLRVIVLQGSGKVLFFIHKKKLHDKKMFINESTITDVIEQKCRSRKINSVLFTKNFFVNFIS